MKNKLISLVVITIIFAGCHADTDVLPGDTWSSGCVQLAPNENGYRLSGMCCAYAQMPRIVLKANRTFSTLGSYHNFTGYGYNSTPIVITGNLSSDGKTLTIGYGTSPGAVVSYTLSSGAATLFCLCGCR